MRYFATADTDIGVIKKTNQDSLLIKHAKFDEKEFIMAIVCDGMGGLAKGEVASATVIDSFARWFKDEFINELENGNMKEIGVKWSNRIKDLNQKILNYSKEIGVGGVGTTFTGCLIFGDDLVCVHVGDSRLYEITNQVKQVTNDQTFIAREISRGTMTPEQAKTDKRRNLLLQCVGASINVEPEIMHLKVNKGTYMLCSDGFRHEISNNEIYQALNSSILFNKETMHNNAKYLIQQVKSRGERDNISVILIKAE